MTGADLLEAVRSKITDYCVLPNTHTEVAVTLWVATTHVLPAFEFAPRLVARSKEKRSGKTRLQEVVDPMVARPLRTTNATTAYVFRSLAEDPPPTLLFDEADTIFGSKKVAENNEDLRGLLNSGFQRGTPVGRCVGPNSIPTEFPTFAMAMLCGIGRMPDTIEDRAVVVVMRRRKSTEQVAPYRTRRDKPALVGLGEQLAAWGAEIVDDLADAAPVDMGIEDRAADTWEPLVAVADAAGGRWPALARDAARVLTADAAEAEKDDSEDVALLRDINAVFTEEFLPSAQLCSRLRGIEESPWGEMELTPHKLGQRMRQYGIKTGFKDRTKTARGYHRLAFKDTFERYLPPDAQGSRPQPSHTVRTPSDQHERADALMGADAFKPSAPAKPSNGNRRSDPVPTVADACGRGYGERSAADVCPTHGTPYGKTGKCLQCITERAHERAS